MLQQPTPPPEAPASGPADDYSPGHNSAPPAPIELITPAQAAARLGVSKQLVYKLTGSGELPCVRLTDACVRINPRDLDAWIDARTSRASSLSTDAGAAAIPPMAPRRRGRPAKAGALPPTWPTRESLRAAS